MDKDSQFGAWNVIFLACSSVGLQAPLKASIWLPSTFQEPKSSGKASVSWIQQHLPCLLQGTPRGHQGLLLFHHMSERFSESPQVLIPLWKFILSHLLRLLLLFGQPLIHTPRNTRQARPVGSPGYSSGGPTLKGGMRSQNRTAQHKRACPIFQASLG